MLRAEYIPTTTPPTVRFTGEVEPMAALGQALEVMDAASRAAFVSGQPFICSPEEAAEARMDWNAHLRQEAPNEVRVVDARTGTLAYRGLVRAYANVQEEIASRGILSHDVMRDRMYKLGNAIGELEGLRRDLTGAGFFQ